MTDNFKFIYKILKTLESAMDIPEFDISQISAERLGVSSERWGRYLEMMVDVGLIKGVRVYTDCTGNICSWRCVSRYKSAHPRDKMSQRSVLAHEYYRHRAYRGTKLNDGAWNDEFRASYSAAKNSPGLSDEDKIYLVLDALEIAKEKGVSVRYNKFIRGTLYGEQS